MVVFQGCYPLESIPNEVDLLLPRHRCRLLSSELSVSIQSVVVKSVARAPGTH